MYIIPRMQALRIGCALFAAFLSVAATAQNAHSHSSGAQANLRIDVIVVRAVGPHRHDRDKDRDRDENTVVYQLQPRDEQLSISREVRPMLVEIREAGAQEQQVQLTTVVIR